MPERRNAPEASKDSRERGEETLSGRMRDLEAVAASDLEVREYEHYLSGDVVDTDPGAELTAQGLGRAAEAAMARAVTLTVLSESHDQECAELELDAAHLLLASGGEEARAAREALEECRNYLSSREGRAETEASRPSQEAFFVETREGGRKEVSSFQDLLKARLRLTLARQLRSGGEGEDPRRVLEVAGLYHEASVWYAEAEEGEVPEYWKMLDSEPGENPDLILVDEDRRFLAAAIGAQRIAGQAKEAAYYVSATEDAKARVDAFLQGHGTRREDLGISDRDNLADRSQEELVSPGGEPHYIETGQGLVCGPGEVAERERLRAWVRTQAVFRNFARRADGNEAASPEGLPHHEIEANPRDTYEHLLDETTPEDIAELTEARAGKLLAAIDRLLPDESPERHAELLEDVTKLYEVGRDIVGPAVVDFARWSMTNIDPDNPPVFLARDGLGPWLAARTLARQGELPEVKEDRLRYVTLSRKLMYSTGQDDLKRYLAQSGIEDDQQPLMMVDVGMYGSIHMGLQDLYPQKPLQSRYFISMAGQEGFHGFWYDSAESQAKPKPLARISGNPVVHFLEDNFSGLERSAATLEAKGEELAPSPQPPFEGANYVKRLAALNGIVDRAKLGAVGLDDADSLARLEAYFEQEFPDDQARFVIPHE